MSTCGADTEANELALSLIGDKDFNIELPSFDDPLYDLPKLEDGGFGGDIARLKNSDLTTKTVDGDGTFDFLMAGFNAHLKKEFEQNRITGEQYAKAYIALTEGAMSNATQFLLGKDAAYWAAISAQIQAQRAQVEVVTARVMLAAEKTRMVTLKYEALNAQSTYALNKIRLSTESIQYCIAKFNLDNMLPSQKALLLKQIDQTTEEILGITARNAQTDEQTKGIRNDNLLHPLRESMLVSQVAGQNKQNDNLDKQGLLLTQESEMHPKKLDMLDKQVLGQIGQNTLLDRQAENMVLEASMYPLKKSMLQKQIDESTAQVLNIGKQGILLDNEAGMNSLKMDMLAKQILGLTADNTFKSKQTESLQKDIDLFPSKKSMLDAQATGQIAQNLNAGKQGLLLDQQVEVAKKELELQPYKINLMKEQAESQRAQTLDDRSDGVPIAGSLGKQKDLYSQQIISYKRDGEMKAAKVFIDAWVTMKTLDEGLAPPTGFANTNLDSILVKLKTNNGL